MPQMQTISDMGHLLKEWSQKNHGPEAADLCSNGSCSVVKLYSQLAASLVQTKDWDNQQDKRNCAGSKELESSSKQ